MTSSMMEIFDHDQCLVLAGEVTMKSDFISKRYIDESTIDS